MSARADLKGKLFGDLFVKDYDPRAHAWLCHCVCGRLVNATARDLRAGAITSCGCGGITRPRGNPRGLLDLTGRRFGKLVAKHYDGEKRQWLCQCDCGRTHLVRSDNLRKGTTTSCGCAYHRVRTKDGDATLEVASRAAPGARFGKLTVLGKSRERVGLWECLCDCGNTRLARADNLTQGRTKSCGCLRSGETTPLTRTRYVWAGINHATRNPASPHWEPVGGKGIGIDPRWHDYETFLADMGEAPDGARLSRRDPTGDYTPENCYWRIGIA